MKTSYKKGTFGYCSLIFIISIVIKIFQYNFLPVKYFYDSNHILSLMNGNYIADKSYNFTARVFDGINVFNFSSLLEWSIFLSCIFTFIIFFIIIQKREYTLVQYIFIYSSMALLNIYVFNLSKDIIQFVFFLILYFIIINKKLSNINKLILSSIILLYEALNFRIYYALMLMLMWTLYFIYLLYIKNKEVTNKTVIKMFLIAIIAFFIEVFIVGLLSSENYTAIMNARSSVNVGRDSSIDAVTIINDLLGKNTNHLIFIGNYLINSLRLMMPIELFFKGIKYIPFIIYQLFVTYNLFKIGKKISDSNILIVISVISFIMISIIFEPDFGSFIRHESTMILFLIEICLINNKERLMIYNEKESKCNSTDI